MKQFKMPIIVAITAIIVGSGVYTTTGVFGTNSLLYTQSTPVDETQGLMGHVILEARDAHGNLYAYRQTDNMIFNGGANCIGKLVFGANATNLLSGCATYHYVALGTNATTADATGKSRDFASFLQELTGTSRVDASGTNLGVTNSTSTGSSAGAGAVASIGNTITIGSTGGTITTVGLANSATSNSGDLFSRVQLGSSIGVNPSDTVKVSWYITINH